MNIRWKDWCYSWTSNILTTWWELLAHWKRPWCWERLRAREEGFDRGWDGWMASTTQWIWVWENSGRWWRTGKPGMLQSMRSQTVRHDWATEQQQHVLPPGTEDLLSPSGAKDSATYLGKRWGGILFWRCMLRCQFSCEYYLTHKKKNVCTEPRTEKYCDKTEFSTPRR